MCGGRRRSTETSVTRRRGASGPVKTRRRRHRAVLRALRGSQRLHRRPDRLVRRRHGGARVGRTRVRQPDGREGALQGHVPARVGDEPLPREGRASTAQHPARTSRTRDVAGCTIPSALRAQGRVRASLLLQGVKKLPPQRGRTRSQKRPQRSAGGGRAVGGCVRTPLPYYS